MNLNSISKAVSTSKKTGGVSIKRKSIVVV
jgi:hypothetical protein